MITYAFRRVLALIPTLLIISAITFFMGFLAPGDPITLLLGERATAEEVAAARHLYGLDKPPLVQFGRYLAGLAHGDLGKSFAFAGRPVSDMVSSGFLVSLQIGSLAALGAAGAGMTLGIIAAVYRRRWPDTVSMFLATLGVSVPGFVEAIALMYLLGVWVHILPVQGWGEPKNYVLPVMVLGTRSAAFIARITRSAMLDVLGQDFVRTARSKGLTEKAVILRHAVKNAMVPVITVLGTTMGSLITGTFIIEQIFGVPGVGHVVLGAIFQRDYPAIQAGTLVVATVFVLVNLVVDLLYGVVDPRIRYA